MGWAVAGAGYIGGNAVNGARGIANAAANALVIAGDTALEAANPGSNVLTSLAGEARAEINAFVEQAAPSIDAFRADWRGATTSAVSGAGAAIATTARAVADGESQAVLDVLSNLSPRRLMDSLGGAARHAVDTPPVGAPRATVIREDVSGSASARLDPPSSPVYTIKEARRLSGANRGVIFVREPQRGGPAAEFEAGSSGAFSVVDGTQMRGVPALRFDNPNPSPRANNFVRFDGYEDGGYTLVDRKTQLTTKTKQLADIDRVVEAARQNRHVQVIYELPTPGAAESARRILMSRGASSYVQVRVAGQ